MPIPFPALSEDGWVTNPATVGDYMFSHFYLAENSQSYLYLGNVTSLPALVQQYQDDPNGLQIAVQTKLAEYFGRIFTGVTVETEVRPEVEDSSRYVLEIYVSYLDDDGTPYTVGELFNVMNTKISKITEANNNGPAHA